MKRYPPLIALSLLMLFSSSCDVREILPNDLSDPAHARYVASGDKEKDRQQFHAYIIICNDLLQPYFDANYAECILKSSQSVCANSQGRFMGIVACAAALVDYHPGARSDEFNNSESY